MRFFQLCPSKENSTRILAHSLPNRRAKCDMKKEKGWLHFATLTHTHTHTLVQVDIASKHHPSCDKAAHRSSEKENTLFGERLLLVLYVSFFFRIFLEQSFSVHWHAGENKILVASSGKVSISMQPPWSSRNLSLLSVARTYVRQGKSPIAPLPKSVSLTQSALWLL